MTRIVTAELNDRKSSVGSVQGGEECRLVNRFRTCSVKLSFHREALEKCLNCFRHG